MGRGRSVRCSGLVGARNGPSEVDLAWCRLDLVLLGAPRAAAAFLTSYERSAGVSVSNIHAWDLRAAADAEDAVESWAPNYQGIGRHDLTRQVLRDRLDAWSAHLINTDGRAR